MGCQALETKDAHVALVTPDRMLGFEVGATNYPHHLRQLYRAGVKLTPDLELQAVPRKGNRLVATLASEFTKKTWTREVDQVVVEFSTKPVDDLYFALKPQSSNNGEVDHKALIFGQPQMLKSNKKGTFQLFRIGDAVAARNVHAGMYDAVRLVKDL